MHNTDGRDDIDLPRSFIVQIWAWIFNVLRLFSLFTLLRALFPRLRQKEISYAFVEAWVLGNTLLAMAAAFFSRANLPMLPIGCLLIYGNLRVFEIVVYQVNVLFFDEWRCTRKGENYALRGYRRMMILLLHNYAEVVLWLVAALLNFHRWSWLALDDPSLSATFRSALVSMVAFSIDGVRPLTEKANAFLTVQSVVGIFMTVLALVRFLSLIPSPETQDPGERINNTRNPMNSETKKSRRQTRRKSRKP